jgi:phospholipid/cholesterol/gamma-HCH transport system permease protein
VGHRVVESERREGAAAPARLDSDRSEGGVLRIRLAGDWRGLGSRPPASGIDAAIRSDGGVRKIAFDSAGLGGWDSLLLTLLLDWVRKAEVRRIEVDPSGLPEGARKLLDLARAVPEHHTEEHAREPSFLARVGESVEGLGRDGAEFLRFLGDAILSFGRLATGRAQVQRSEVWLTIQQCGAGALPIVTLISVLVGLILAFVGAMQLELFGAEIYVANLVAIGTTREMGAMMAAIIMAGRTGAAFAAQLGTMTVREEIDALSTLGISPMDFLVLPRMLALVLMMPLLCLYADFLAILGGAIVSITSFDLAPIQYWTQTQGALTLTHIGVGVFKSGIFGVVVALSGCLRGMQCGRSASAVGDAATSAVVTGIVLIVVCDSLVTVVTTIVGI